MIWYIYWQMVNNAEGEIIDLLQNWNGSDFTSVWEDMPDWTPGVGEGWNDAALADAGTKAAAFAFFGYMVRQQGPWDPKPEIARLFKYSQEIGGEWYYYDIWGNIMFGYLGAASGFSESALLDGAGIEQIGSSTGYAIRYQDLDYSPKRQTGISGLRAWDDPIDQAASQIGIELWNSHGLDITPIHIMQAVTSEPRIPVLDEP